jgi:hypothetical protein
MASTRWNFLVVILLFTFGAITMAEEFNGLYTNLSNLSRLSNVQSRSISPENFTGEKSGGATIPQEKGNAAHAASELGTGWKVNPYVRIEPNQTFVMADIKGSGAIQHIWMTPTGDNHRNIIRFYWDGEDKPSIECPVADFFATGLCQYMTFSSLAVCVNPGSGFNCYWSMPFRKSAKITMTNTGEKRMTLYYQVDYALAKYPKTQHICTHNTAKWTQCRLRSLYNS